MSITRIGNTAELRSVDSEDRTIDIIASTIAKDSHGTRVDQSGWILDDFKRNPVITWAHDDRGFTASGGRPIAKALPETVRVEGGKLRMKIRFPKEGTFKFADEVFELARQGFISSVSVGFEPIEDEQVEEDGEIVRIFRKQKLLEVAVVTIPSNSEALMERVRHLGANESEIRTRVERVEELAKELPKDDLEEVVAAEIEEPEVEQKSNDGTYEAADIEKWKGYFDNKQPINKKSTSVLEKFFKKIGEEQPADEAEAWTRMAELVEAIEQTETPEEVVEPVVEEKVEEPTLPTQGAEEAPQPEQKASASIPLDVLLSLPTKMTRLYIEAAVEALQRGVPTSELGTVIDSVAQQLGSNISKSISNPKNGENSGLGGAAKAA